MEVLYIVVSIVVIGIVSAYITYINPVISLFSGLLASTLLVGIGITIIKFIIGRK